MDRAALNLLDRAARGAILTDKRGNAASLRLCGQKTLAARVFGAQFFEVEIVFDGVQHLVADETRAVHAQDFGAARAHGGQRNSTRPAASLSRLSPSSRTMMRRGSASRSSTARAATASGGDTTAPSAKHTAHGSVGATQCATRPTAQVVNATAPMANSRIGVMWRLKSAQTKK
jgi:hypothetical protein